MALEFPLIRLRVKSSTVKDRASIPLFEAMFPLIRLRVKSSTLKATEDGQYLFTSFPLIRLRVKSSTKVGSDITVLNEEVSINSTSGEVFD